MTVGTFKKRCEELNIPDDADITEGLYLGTAVDMEYDKDDNTIILIFD